MFERRDRKKSKKNAVSKNRKLDSDLNVLYHILQSSKVSERSRLTKLGPQKKLKLFLQSHVKLNKEVGHIASMKEKIDPEADTTLVSVKKTKNIIHNRINKAGSTSMMGENIQIKLGRGGVQGRGKGCG